MEPVTREDSEKVARSLLDRTERGELAWRRVVATGLLPADATPLNVFTCEFEGARWLLAEFNERAYDGENDRWYTETDALLALTDGATRLYDFPRTAGLWELLLVVKAHSAGVQDLIARVVGKK